MRLLFVTKDFPPHIGGIQRMAQELGERLVKSCDDFLLIAPKVKGWREVDAKLPFEVYRVPSSKGSFAGLVGLHLVPLLRKRRFDVALGAQWQSTLGPLLHRGDGPHQLKHVFAMVIGREILTRHYEMWPLAPATYARVRKSTLDRVDGLIGISRYSLGLAQELGVTTRSQVVLLGVDPQSLTPGDATATRERLGLQGKSVLLSTGRLVPRKGVDTVLHALQRIRESVPALKYLVVGDGPDRERLERLARELRVADIVSFLGRVSDEERIELYRACDVFVLAAREERPDVEGFGLVLLEASACAKPVVSTNSGGVPEVVVNDKTGLITPANDAASLADTVLRVLSNPGFASELGQAGRRHVEERANWDSVARELNQLLVSWTQV
jgi:phosphatidylinositol alpha-1,6-mannosyltransferase